MRQIASFPHFPNGSIGKSPNDSEMKQKDRAVETTFTKQNYQLDALVYPFPSHFVSILVLADLIET